MRHKVQKRTASQTGSCSTAPDHNPSDDFPSSLTVSLGMSIWMATPAPSIDILISRLKAFVELPGGTMNIQLLHNIMYAILNPPLAIGWVNSKELV